MIREACWGSIHDKYRNDSTYYHGEYRPSVLMGSFVSGIARQEEDLDISLYLGGEHGIFEHRYIGGWLPWNTHHENLLPERQISVLRGGSGSVSIFFVQGEWLVEAQRRSGTTTRTPILPKLACSGTECPGRLIRELQCGSDADGIRHSGHVSATRADENQVYRKEADRQENDGKEDDEKQEVQDSNPGPANEGNPADTGSANQDAAISGPRAKSNDAQQQSQQTSLESTYITSKESRLISNITDPNEYEDNERKDQETDDATIFSDASAESTTLTDNYVSEFVDEAFERLQPQTLGRESLHRCGRVEKALPDLLKGFALRFGQESQSKEQKKIVFFTYNHNK